jgi:PhnB protein
MSTKPVPAGYHTITPQLAIDGAAKAIEFYKKAFGAEVLDQAPDPSGTKVWHASLRIGDSMLFVNDVFPDMGGEHSRSALWLYVPDVDASYKRAVDAGAKGTQPPADMFWGDRMAHVADPFGQKWAIATHVKDMTPEEMQKAMAEFTKQMAEHGPPPAQPA